MGADSISPTNEGTGNDAYQNMARELATVTAKERGRR